jgi:hypothetical protein
VPNAALFLWYVTFLRWKLRALMRCRLVVLCFAVALKQSRILEGIDEINTSPVEDVEDVMDRVAYTMAFQYIYL